MRSARPRFSTECDRSAAAFFAGAVVIGVRPDLGLEIFGGLWVVTLVGVGVTLKLGGTLGEPPKEPEAVG